MEAKVKKNKRERRRNKGKRNKGGERKKDLEGEDKLDKRKLWKKFKKPDTHRK